MLPRCWSTCERFGPIRIAKTIGFSRPRMISPKRANSAFLNFVLWPNSREKNAVIDLYYLLRNFSMRAESEWRPDYLRCFKKTIADTDLPESLGDLHWLSGVDPATGIPIAPPES